MRTFTERLEACQTVTQMTVSDLARWFDRPRATVNTWLNGRTPFGPPAKLAEQKLALLEWSVRQRAKKFYPVPAHLTWKEREVYVRGMCDDAEQHARISPVRAAG